MVLKKVLSALNTKRLMVLVLLLSLFAMSVRPITDPDFWWHLRTGQLIWETRSIPRHDVFSYTVSAHPWVTHEWLAEILMYGVYAISGQAGLIIAFALVITGAFALLYLQCPGRPYLASFLVVWAAIASAVTWGVRPQMFSLLLSSITLYILYLYHRRRRWVIWLLPPLMVIWANLHGSFFLGLVYPAVYLLGGVIDSSLRPQGEGARSWADLRRLFVVTILTAVAPVVNPNGVELLTYPFGTLGSSAMQAYIMEWFSPDFHLAQYQPFAAYILGLLLILALSTRIPRATELLLTIGFGYASLRSARFIPYFTLAATPTLASQLLNAWEQSSWSKRFRAHRSPRGRMGIVANWLLLAVLAFGVVVFVGHTLRNNPKSQEETFPVAAADFLLKNNLTGNIYNLYHWGGYLIWRLYPEYKVFIDGRADVYGDTFIEEYLQVYQLRGSWTAPLESYGVRLILIDPGSALSTVLGESASWDRAYADDEAVVYVKKDEANP
jgi:hypothetical protein